MTEQEWRKKAHDFLKAANFEKGFCHLKLRDKDKNSGRYLNFGIVFPGDVCQIHLLDEHGNDSGKTQEWNSIDEMLDAGWDVD